MNKKRIVKKAKRQNRGSRFSTKTVSRLGVYFTLIVFHIMLSTAILMFFLAFVLFRLGHLNISEGRPFFPFVLLLFLSVVIGVFLSVFIGKIILKPITKFSKAVSKVAKGNFNVRLDENSKIEEIRELSHNFNIMVKELSGIETLRNDFVVNVSHEFKTPIASIEGYATLLQDRNLTESERDEYTRMIIDSSRQLASLSGNILLLSKLENQEGILEKKPYLLDEQIRQAILLLETAWSDKGIEWDIELPKTRFHGNENLLMQVWMNLIGNAIKFSHKNGTIQIKMDGSGDGVTVTITDHGYGMEESTIRHVFDKFYQGDSTRKSDGNGLGLALVKRIVDLCEGEVTVASKRNQGSTFTVTLPNRPSDREKHAT